MIQTNLHKNVIISWMVEVVWERKGLLENGVYDCKSANLVLQRSRLSYFSRNRMETSIIDNQLRV